MDAAAAKRLFDTNAAHYDRLNRIMSAGLDRRWRSWAASQAAWQPSASVLELMCGTGEISVEAARMGASVQAVDASPHMLSIAAERAELAGVAIRTTIDDATAPTSLSSAAFDSVVVSFGLRYVDDREGFLRSLRCLLKPSGRIVILEFCVPRPGVIRTPAAIYFFRLMPWLGAALSGGSYLYEYLPESVRAFGSAEGMIEEVRSAGFSVISERRLGFGLVTGIVARRRN